MIRSVSLLTFCLCGVALMARTYDPWPMPDDTQADIIYVQTGAPEGGTGEKDNPFANVSLALGVATKRAINGNVIVLLGNGVYRESVLMEGKTSGHWLTIQAKEIGKAIISGSEIFSDWEQLENGWQAPWKQKFGFTPNPFVGMVSLKSSGFRSEWLFLNGNPQTQVLSESELGPGKYWIDEKGARVLLVPPPGINPRKALVEITTRGGGTETAHFVIRNSRYVKLKGLVVTHGASAIRPAANLHGSSEMIVEDCRFDFNNGQGFGIGTLGALYKSGTRFPSNIIVRRVSCDSNGVVGFGASVSNSLWEDVSANGNNARGMLWGAAGWFTCGFKYLVLGHSALRRITTHGNLAHGAWFDTAIEDVMIEDLRSFGNRRYGLVLEASAGPIKVNRSIIAGNGEGGVLGFDTCGVTLSQVSIVGNRRSQLVVAGSLPFSEEELGKVKGDPFRHDRLSRALIPRNWEISQSVIGVLASNEKKILEAFARQSNAPKVVDGRGLWAPFFDSLKGDGLKIFHPEGSSAPQFSSEDFSDISFEAMKQKVSGAKNWTWDEVAVRQAWAKVENEVVRVAVPGNRSALELGQ